MSDAAWFLVSSIIGTCNVKTVIHLKLKIVIKKLHIIWRIIESKRR